MKHLRIAQNLSLPLDAVTQTFAVMAIRGVGKTHTATVLAEEMLKADQPVCVYDPTGAWYGLKSSADGKKPGFEVVVFGGEHADVPLEESAGETVARVIVDKRIPAVLDTSLMRKAARVRFMTDFAETLYHRNREPLHLILDEAQTIAPQKPFPEVARLLGAMEDIVLQGRRRGLGATIISQRPALVNKNVLTQCSVLIAMRIIGPQDRSAIEDWIEAHGDKEKAREVLSSLAALEIGEGWVWSPGWLRTLVRVKFRQRETFDSSATPEVGKRVARPSAVAAIDLAALGEEIRQTVERTKADDPRELKRRIAELERKLAQAPQQVEKIIEVPVLNNGQLEATIQMVSHLGTISRELVQTADGLATTIRAATSRNHTAAKASAPTPGPPSPSKPDSRESCVSAKVTGGLRRMLIALAQRPQGLSTRQLGVRAGMSSKSGTFGTYLGRARTEGWIDGRRECVRLTDVGRESLGDFEPLPTGRALLSYWLAELGNSGDARMLGALADTYPDSLTAHELGESAGISSGSGTFGTYLGKLRSLELVEGARDSLRASAELFD